IAGPKPHRNKPPRPRCQGRPPRRHKSVTGTYRNGRGRGQEFREGSQRVRAADNAQLRMATKRHKKTQEKTEGRSVFLAGLIFGSPVFFVVLFCAFLWLFLVAFSSGRRQGPRPGKCRGCRGPGGASAGRRGGGWRG